MIRLFRLPSKIRKQLPVGIERLNTTNCPYYAWTGTLARIDRGIFLTSTELDNPFYYRFYKYFAPLEVK